MVSPSGTKQHIRSVNEGKRINVHNEHVLTRLSSLPLATKVSSNPPKVDRTM